jgi:LacI family transcriptional regulator
MAPKMDDDPPMAEAERPTLKTIAQATGLAIATVSRALKDAPDIGEATKTRVREVALSLGYRPNRAGVRLRTGKTNVIALVLSAESDVMNNTAKLIYSIAQALRGTSYHMVVMPFFGDQNVLDPIRYIVETGSADGVILNQTEPDDPRLSYLHAARMPFATHGRSDMGLDHAYFDYDNHAFGALAVQALAARGRKRVRLLAPPAHQMYGQHMIAGATQAAQALGLALTLSPTHADQGGAAIEAALRGLFGTGDAPDGIISASTTGAMAAIAAAEGCGAVLGRDFDLVSKEAIQFMHRFRREVIIAQEDVAQAGDFLARAVVAAIEGKGTAPAKGLQVPRAADFCTASGPIIPPHSQKVIP